MAVTATEKSVRCSIKLDATEGSGETVIKSINLGSLKTGAFDKDKAMNIVNLIIPCLEYPLHHVESTVVNTLTASA